MSDAGRARSSRPTSAPTAVAHSARDVAKRALLEARRNGLGVDEFIKAIRRVAAEEEEQHPSRRPPPRDRRRARREGTRWASAAEQ